MKITSTGVAVALAVVVALGFLFFGPAIFTPFSTQPNETTIPVEVDLTSPTTMDTLPTQLTIEDTTVGTGAEAVAGQTVTVHYVGMLPDGTVFDASRPRGEEGFTFPLGAGMVIAGWDQGVAGMKEGGKRTLIIPSDMAYGDAGIPGVIPEKATLIFEVELLKVGN